MPRKISIKDRIERATYDKTDLNKTILSLKKSLDEVSGVLNGKKK